MINLHQRQFKDLKEKEIGDLGKRPEWLKVRLPSGANYADVKNLMRQNRLNTVCEEAKCPNLGECWNRRTATFMILGDTCTRSCGFCNVKLGIPNTLDLDEPRRVAESVAALGLKHVVITSVNRDELKDGGSGIFAETIRLIRQSSPECTIEILIPDFKGEQNALNTILHTPPDILNHNLETIPGLYHAVRPQAKYERSLEVLHWFARNNLTTKSGIMVGIGEKPDEILSLMRDLRSVDCKILTIGQYLQPSFSHIPVKKFYSAIEFKEMEKFAKETGFEQIFCNPLVRSSYHA
ncbi:MAG: lipoyl synthase, partial [Ignavibacteriales bacterium]|nr:lipoyl synthase [Ignavibacteriales bacterium]